MQEFKEGQRIFLPNQPGYAEEVERQKQLAAEKEKIKTEPKISTVEYEASVLRREEDKVIEQLDKYRRWLMDYVEKCEFTIMDFCKNPSCDGGIKPDFFYKAKEKFQDSERVMSAFAMAGAVRADKIVSLATRNKIDVSMAIFYLKAQEKWRDGNSGPGGVGVQNNFNFTIDNMRLPDIEKKIKGLLEDMSNMPAMEKLQAIEAEFKEIK